MVRAVLTALLLAFALFPTVAMGQDKPALPQLEGMVQAPLRLDEAMLRSLPAASIDISFLASSGTEKGHFTGVLLWDVLQKAGLVNGAGKNAQLRHAILVTGRDGYAAAIAEGEIDPSYEDKKVIIAFEGDSVSFDHLRLLVPGDAHGGRSVSDLATIEVK